MMSSLVEGKMNREYYLILKGLLPNQIRNMILGARILWGCEFRKAFLALFYHTQKDITKA